MTSLRGVTVFALTIHVTLGDLTEVPVRGGGYVIKQIGTARLFFRNFHIFLIKKRIFHREKNLNYFAVLETRYRIIQRISSDFFQLLSVHYYLWRRCSKFRENKISALNERSFFVSVEMIWGLPFLRCFCMWQL